MRRRRGRLFAVLVILLAVIAGLCARTWGVGLTRITGTSMEGTLRDGDIALVTRFDYLNGKKPALGDVVECRFPGRRDIYVKRVAGLPEQSIEIDGGALHIDGQRLSEPYVSSFAEDYAVTLGQDEYLMLGDNRAESYDSRMADMGPVGMEAFLGRVRLVVWPINHIGIVR